MISYPVLTPKFARFSGLVDNVLGIFRLLHLHAVRRSDAHGGGNKSHQGGCEVLKNTLMHVRRSSGINHIDYVSLSSAMLQQLLHGMQREIAALNEELLRFPNDSGLRNQLSRLLGSTWHIAFFVNDKYISLHHHQLMGRPHL